MLGNPPNSGPKLLLKLSMLCTSLRVHHHSMAKIKTFLFQVVYVSNVCHYGR